MAEEKEEIDRCLPYYDYFFRPDLLAGKVALITGGGSGICFIIAEVFMRHKCSTVIVGRKIDRLRRAAQKLENCTGQRCLPVKMDVRKVDEVAAGVNAALKTFSRIDILINGAAGNFLCPASSLSYNGIKTVIDIDTLGTFNVSKAVYKSCFQEHGGSIINITATLHYRGAPLQLHAGTAKAAVDAMTRHLAVEWGPEGVRVNCLAPGAIKNTEGFRRLGGTMMPKDYIVDIPVQRLGESRDIADAALFLASSASSYVTGTTMVVDGGHCLTRGVSMPKVTKMMSKL